MSEEPIEALLEREFETTGGYRLQLAHALPEIAAHIRAQAAEIERLNNRIVFVERQLDEAHKFVLLMRRKND